MRQYWNVSVFPRCLVLLTRAGIEEMLNVKFKTATKLFYLVKCSFQFLGIWHTSPNFHGYCLVSELRFINVCTTAIGEAIVTGFNYDTLLKNFHPWLVERKQCQKGHKQRLKSDVERTIFSCMA